jgi:hypothetical protein
MKKEKISNKNGKTDSEEDVKINKVNENGRWSVFLFSVARSLFSILQKNKIFTNLLK